MKWFNEWNLEISKVKFKFKQEMLICLISFDYLLFESCTFVKRLLSSFWYIYLFSQNLISGTAMIVPENVDTDSLLLHKLNNTNNSPHLTIYIYIYTCKEVSCIWNKFVEVYSILSMTLKLTQCLMIKYLWWLTMEISLTKVKIRSRRCVNW